jgi:subfamily B ATP-binding cassette protein MsbA
MQSKTLYFRLLSYVMPYWRLFTLAIFAIIIMAVTDPVLAALIQPLLDGGFVNKDPATIQIIPLLLMLLVLIKGLAMLTSQVGMTWVASRLVMDLRTGLFGKILTLPATTFDNYSSGVLLSKVTYDVSRVMAAATDTLVILVRDSLTVLGLLMWMFYLNWQLSLIVFTVVPVIIGIVRFISQQLRGINLSIQEAMGEMTRILEEAISGHKLVKIFSGQHYEQTRFQMASNQVRQLEVKTQMTSGLSVFIVQMLTALALSIIVYIATRQSTTDNITVGGFVSLFTAMGMLFAPVKRLTKVNDQLQQGLAAAQSVFDLLDQAAETNELCQPTRKKESLIRLAGKLSFQQLEFTYDKSHRPVLQAISLTIMPGEMVALVGTSGSGKTTLAHLIPRFYPLANGQLLVDDIDINELPLSDLRANIALVSQEVVLFNDSVAANIAYGEMAAASREQIIAAAQLAYAMEFIEQMPNHLETIIGERGVKLSGGQRQRLAIARAFLKNAPILILDEATSALDNHSEFQVQTSLKKLKSGRTTIIIAHRLSTIATADRIVVMDQGRVVENGTHVELLAQQGVYAKLYQGATQGNETNNSGEISDHDIIK